MAGDQNARRDKALEAISRELAETNKHLKRIADNGRSMKFTTHPPDPFTTPEPPSNPGTNPFPDSSHPYLRRSQPDELGPDTDRTTGPYGTRTHSDG